MKRPARVCDKDEKPSLERWPNPRGRGNAWVHLWWCTALPASKLGTSTTVRRFQGTRAGPCSWLRAQDGLKLLVKWANLTALEPKEGVVIQVPQTQVRTRRRRVDLPCPCNITGLRHSVVMLFVF